MTLPLDVKSAWLNVIRRLQSVCSRNKGLMIIRIDVLVKEDGEPVLWTEPKTTLLEGAVD